MQWRTSKPRRYWKKLPGDNNQESYGLEKGTETLAFSIEWQTLIKKAIVL